MTRFIYRPVIKAKTRRKFARPDKAIEIKIVGFSVEEERPASLIPGPGGVRTVTVRITVGGSPPVTHKMGLGYVLRLTPK